MSNRQNIVAECNAHLPLLRNSEFVALPDGVAHLYCGGEAPVLRAAFDGLREYATDKSAGARGRRRMEERVEETRSLLGRRLDLPNAERCLGFAASVSHGLDLVARAFAGRPGDAVLLADDFPSLPLAFAIRGAPGAGLRFVSPGEGCEERLVAAITSGTRVVCVSHVNHRTGRRLDLAPVASACRPAGVPLIVDASHSAGVIPVPAEHCDVIVSCTHKFLFGLHGVGFVHWNEDRLGPLPVTTLGWNSVTSYGVADGTVHWTARDTASAIEAGNPNFGSLYALKGALDRIDLFPLPTIEAHAVKLADSFKAMLVDRGIPLLTPIERAKAGTSVAVPCADAELAGARLAEQGVLAAASEGRLRFSFHAHNRQGDADRAAATLAAVLQ
jgi:selenocysteine lyase/cysteine desulfurase